jgi:hypothetical protein
MKLTVFTLSIVALLVIEGSAARPNILWITIEDWSPDLSCYGTKGIHTAECGAVSCRGYSLRGCVYHIARLFDFPLSHDDWITPELHWCASASRA